MIFHVICDGNLENALVIQDTPWYLCIPVNFVKVKPLLF